MKTPVSALCSAVVALYVGLLLVHTVAALRVASPVPHLRGAVPMMRPAEVHAMHRHLESQESVGWTPSDFHVGKTTRLPAILQHSPAPAPSMRAVHGPREAHSTSALPWGPSMFRTHSEPLLPTVRLSSGPRDWRAANVSHRSVFAPHTATDP